MTKDCKRCDKKGIPLMLARWSIAQKNGLYDSGAKLPQAQQFPKLPNGFIYTLRRIRSGYIYVFDQASKEKLKVYMVESNSCLTQISQDLPVSKEKQLANTHANCINDAASGYKKFSNSVLLTVEKPDVSRSIYISYSKRKWTKRIYDKHLNDANYRKHMIEVKINSKNPHCFLLDNINLVIAEYMMNLQEIKKNIPWENFTKETYKNKVENVKKEGKRLQSSSKQVGLIVPVFDFNSMLEDISNLVVYNEKQLYDKNKHKYDIALNISDIKHAILEEDLNKIVNTYVNIDLQQQKKDVNAEFYYGDVNEYIRNNPGVTPQEYYKRYDAALKSPAPVIKDIDSKLTTTQLASLEAKLKVSQKAAWAKYNQQLTSPDIHETFLKSFEKLSRNLHNNVIMPLGEVHKKWFESKFLIDYMTYIYDGSDIRSGIYYAIDVAHYLGVTQNIPICRVFYESQLTGGSITKSNLIMRSIVFNQDKNINIINNTKYNFLEPSNVLTMPWSSVLGGITAIAHIAIEAEYNQLAQLFANLAKPIMTSIESGIKGQANVNQMMLSLGVHFNKAIFLVEMNGTLADHHKVVSAEIAKATKIKVNPNSLDTQVKTQLYKLQRAGLVESKNDLKAKRLIAIDLNQVKEIEKLQMNTIGKTGRLPSVLVTNEAKLQEIMKKSLDQSLAKDKIRATGLGLATAAFQAFAISVYLKTMLKDGSFENSMKFLGSWITGIAVIAEIAERYVAKGISQIKHVGFGLGSQAALKSIKLAGFIGGAVIFAAFDFKKSYDEKYQYDNKFISRLYFFSAFTGLLSTYILATATTMLWTGIGIFLVLVALGLGIAVNYFKNNDIQNWMRNGLWGVSSAKWDLQTEAKELTKIINKMNQQATA